MEGGLEKGFGYEQPKAAQQALLTGLASVLESGYGQLGKIAAGTGGRVFLADQAQCLLSGVDQTAQACDPSVDR